MMTQTHLLVAPAVLAKSQGARVNAAAIAGALLPDAALFIFFAAGVLSATPQQQ